jgi:hypothetical protein
MKLNGKLMVAVAMMVASAAAIGCNRANAETGPVAPEETPDTAAVVNGTAKSPGVEKDALFFHYYAPVAPPVARVEVVGVAPSARHFWVPGYYRWTGERYLWVTGRWQLRREGYAYAAPHWVNRVGRYEYIPGRWYRRF